MQEIINIWIISGAELRTFGEIGKHAPKKASMLLSLRNVQRAKRAQNFTKTILNLLKRFRSAAARPGWPTTNLSLVALQQSPLNLRFVSLIKAYRDVTR